MATVPDVAAVAVFLKFQPMDLYSCRMGLHQCQDQDNAFSMFHLRDFHHCLRCQQDVTMSLCLILTRHSRKDKGPKVCTESFLP